MYIRRKVFSTFVDEYGQERYFSTTEFINEDAYLDQREFGVVDVNHGVRNGSIGYDQKEFLNFIKKEGYNMDELRGAGKGKGNDVFKYLKQKFEKQKLGELTKGMNDKQAREHLSKMAKEQTEGAVKKGSIVKSTKGLIRRNPKTAALIGGAALAAGGAGIYAANRK